MEPADEFRTLRARLERLQAEADRFDRDRPQGVPRYCGRVYSGGALPTSVPKVFLTRPLTISATESEGATPTLTADATRSVPVLVIGPGVPVAGDDLIARQVSGRWIAPFSAAAPTAIPCTTGCPPASTTLHVTFNYTDCSGNPQTATTTGSGGFGSFWPSPNFTLAGSSCHSDGVTNSWSFAIQCNAGLFTLDFGYVPASGPRVSVVTWAGVKSGSTCSPLMLLMDITNVRLGTAQAWITSVVITL